MDLTWYQVVLGVIVGLLLLMVLVILHELGHAWAARRNGVKVEEFGLGFPPRAKILGKYKGTLITLNWLLPLGGFCKMKDDDDFAIVKKGETSPKPQKAPDADSFPAASFWSKTKILFAGVAANLIAAMVIFSILAATGLPKISASQFTIASDNHGETGVVEIFNVVEDSPAAAAGLREGDEIVSIADNKIEISSQVSELTKKHAGETVSILVARDGESKQLSATLNPADKAENGYLGVQTEQKVFANIRATWSAPIVGAVNTFQFVGITLSGLWDLATNFFGGLAQMVVNSSEGSSKIAAAGESVAGPVGILGVVFPSAVMAGPTQLFFLMGIISLTLAIMNTIPIPGLDGGRWFLTALFRAIKKPLTKEREATINGIGMLVLFGLIILITAADVLKLF